jgi:formylglycine-generating enzyme required for sulfatase activity
VEAPARVGSHPRGAGEFGHDDLAGNLKEWVADTWQARLAERCDQSGASATDEHECLELADEANRVLKGGSFAEPPAELKNAHRVAEFPTAALADIGFRCVRDFR